MPHYVVPNFLILIFLLLAPADGIEVPNPLILSKALIL